MPQLLFEPAASKIAADTYLVVPKNNSDSIDVYESPEGDESEEVTTDIRSGAYHFIAKCSEVVKDILVGFYGNPTTVSGVKTGHTHSAEVVAALLVKYGSTFLPEERTIDGETVSVYVVEWANETESLYETQEAAFTAIVNYAKRQLRAAVSSGETEEEEGEENES